MGLHYHVRGARRSITCERGRTRQAAVVVAVQSGYPVLKLLTAVLQKSIYGPTVIVQGGLIPNRKLAPITSSSLVPDFQKLSTSVRWFWH